MTRFAHYPFSLRSQQWFSGWLLAILVLFLTNRPSFGAPIAANSAFRAATSWLALSPAPMAKKAGSPMGAARTFSSPSGEARFYVVDLAPTGYVVVAPDDQMEPIVAFSHQDRFEGKPGNPLFDLLQKDMAGRKSRTAKGAVAGKSPALAGLAPSAKWHQLLSPSPRSAAVAPRLAGQTVMDDPRVDPLVQSHWDQNTIQVTGSNAAVYNYYTPPYSSGNSNNYDAGCTATAWAQIMRYHQWPTTGVGTQSYSITVNGASQRRALRGGDGNGGAYDWSDMVLAPDATVNSRQCQAIGALLADAGVANGMDYECESSAAYLAPSAIRGAFKYANGVLSPYPASVSGIILALDTNLDAGLPVWLAIENTHFGSGHAVVVDGYGYNAGTLYHHMNMGWSGADDAWYNLPHIETAEPDPEYSFNLLEDCVYNIDPTVKGEIVTGRITGADGNPVAGIPVVAQAGALQYNATTNARGIYAIKGLPSSTTLTIAPGYVASSNPASSQVTTGHSSDGGPVGNRTGINFRVVTDALNLQPVTATVNPAKNGIVTGTGNYELGSPATLTAEPVAGVSVLNWKTQDGAIVSSGTAVSLGSRLSYTFQVSGSCNLVANFWCPPVVKAPTGISTTAVNLNGALPCPKDITWNVCFRYGITPQYGNTTPSETLDSGTNLAPFSAAITGLTPATTYHYCIVATSSEGTFCTPDRTFVTSPYDLFMVAMRTGAAPGVAGAFFSAFGSPSINDSNHVAFQATISPALRTGNSGIWADSGTNQCVLVALTGSAAPGVINGIFTTLGDPVFNDNDRVAFTGELKTGAGGVPGVNATGIWTNGSGTLGLVALSGSQAAGCGPGVVFASFHQLVLPDQGGIIFLAALENGTPGAGVTVFNNLGIWADDGSGQLQLIARKGELQSDSAGSVKITSLSLFANAEVTKVRIRGFNSSGSFVYKAGYSDGTERLCEASYGTAPRGLACAPAPGGGAAAPSYSLSSTTVALNSGSVPQIPGATFASFGYSSLNNAGHTAFLATVSGSGITALDHTGIWAQTGTGDWLVARTGVAINGVAKGKFTYLSNPVNNDGDQIAFMGILNAAVPGIVKANAMGIWTTTSGSLAPVTGEGEPAPGCKGAYFASFRQLALPDQGGAVLVATLNGPGVSAANDEGVWAVDTSGTLRLIVRKGTDILGGASNPITALSVLTSSPVTMPQPCGFNSPGNLIYKATFRDRTQGIFTVVFP